MSNQDFIEEAGKSLWLTVAMGEGTHSKNVEDVRGMVNEWGNNGKVINYGFPGRHHSTPLWEAVALEYYDIVKILLKAEAIDVNKAPTSGWGEGKSPLDIAREQVAKGEDAYEKFVTALEKASETKGGAKKRKSNKNLNKSAKKSKSKHNKTPKIK